MASPSTTPTTSPWLYCLAGALLLTIGYSLGVLHAKKRHSRSSTEEETETRLVPTMDDFLLTLAIRWLSAEDAFSASCVSSQWRTALAGNQDNGDLWKQVFQNSNPSMTFQLQGHAEMNYRLLALGLWGGRQPRVQATTALTYTPTLALNDIFAVVEIYQTQRIEGGNEKTKNTLASWVLPISCPSFIKKDFSYNDEKLTLKGPNPYSLFMRDSEEVQEWQESNNDFREMTPQAFAVHSLMGKVGLSAFDRLDRVIRIDTTLFRRDNMKSVRLLKDAQPFDWESSDIVEAITWDCGEWLKFAPNDEGKTAGSMMYNGGYLRFCVGTCWMDVASNLPPAGSYKEPAWLANCRQAFNDGVVYHPDESDQAALSKITHFEFEAKSVEIDLCRDKVAESEYDQVKNENEMLVALEGLRWE